MTHPPQSEIIHYSIKKPRHIEGQLRDTTNKYFFMSKRIGQHPTIPKNIFSLDQELYYLYKDGIWTSIKEKYFLKVISDYFIDFNDLSIREKKEMLENYKITNFISLDKFNNTKFLNMKNGMLDTYINKLIPHDPKYYSTNQIGYDYIEDAECPLWEKTLNEIFENDPIRVGLLQEFFGYCLTPENNQKKALLLMGDTDTGKSTILDILQFMLGPSNVSTLELEDFENDQLTPMMVNKLVNIDFDVNKDAQKYESGFRKITSMEPINSNQKYEIAFKFVPICKIVMAANAFPKITDYSSAFYNRLILIPMNRRFTEEEKNIGLKECLKSYEMAGILNWCIKGLKRLKDRGKFLEYDFVKQAVKELEDDNNPVNNFLNDHVEIDMGYYIEKGELYKKYTEWSDNNKHGSLPGNRFSSVVFNKFHKNTFRDTKEPDTHKRIWKNLKYVEYKEDKIKRKEVSWQK